MDPREGIGGMEKYLYDVHVAFRLKVRIDLLLRPRLVLHLLVACGKSWPRPVQDSGNGTRGRDGPTVEMPTGVAPSGGSMERNHLRQSGPARIAMRSGNPDGSRRRQRTRARMQIRMSTTSNRRRGPRGCGLRRGCESTRRHRRSELFKKS